MATKLRTLSTAPDRILGPDDGRGVTVGICRLCGYVQTGWAALAEPRFVVGQCLNCYAKTAGNGMG